MDSIFKDQNSDAALLIDAGNAFNSVNREAFIHNVEIVCPVFATFNSNCYSSSSRLLITGELLTKIYRRYRTRGSHSHDNICNCNYPTYSND